MLSTNCMECPPQILWVLWFSISLSLSGEKENGRGFPLQVTGRISRRCRRGTLPGPVKWTTCLSSRELPQPARVPWKLCLILPWSKIILKLRKTCLDTDLSPTCCPFLPSVLCLSLLPFASVLVFQALVLCPWLFDAMLSPSKSSGLLVASLTSHVSAIADPSPALGLRLVSLLTASLLRCPIRTSSSSSPSKLAALPLSSVLCPPSQHLINPDTWIIILGNPHESKVYSHIP